MIPPASLLATLARPCRQNGVLQAVIARPRWVSTKAPVKTIPCAHELARTRKVAWTSSRVLQQCRGISRASIGIPNYAKNLQPRFFSANVALRSEAVQASTSSHASQNSAASESPTLTPPVVGYWLMAITGLIYAVIVVGGVTRLTESGLSITEWKPVSGIIPPLSREEWEEEFTKYKATPEFKL